MQVVLNVQSKAVDGLYAVIIYLLTVMEEFQLEVGKLTINHAIKSRR